MIPRFHIPTPLASGATVELPATTAHHAVRVLRMQSGDPLQLFDGTGGAWQAELKIGAGGTASARLLDFDAADRMPPLSVTLVQALPGGDKMDWIVEKCTELGVAAFQPLAARRSIVKLSAERMARRIDHWNAIAVAACEQSGRNRVPPLAPVIDMPQYLARAKTQNREQNALGLVLAPSGGTVLSALERPSGPVVVMVGPESGWEDGELAAAQTAGFLPVRLGARVLRTETAGPAVLAALLALWGDF